MWEVQHIRQFWRYVASRALTVFFVNCRASHAIMQVRVATMLVAIAATLSVSRTKYTRTT